MEQITPQYDLIIIGCGPAGIAAGIAAKQKGLCVLMIAPIKSTNNIIYESVHSGIQTLTDYIGCTNILLDSVVSEFDGVRYAGIFNEWRGKHLAYKGLNINRTHFDRLLLRSIVDGNGIDFLREIVSDLIIDKNSVVGVITNTGRRILAKYTIDASGFRKIVGRILNLKEEFLSPPLITWTGVCNIGNASNMSLQPGISYFSANANEWSWLALVAPDKCYWTSLSLKGKRLFSPPAILNNYPIIGDIKKSNRRWSIFRPFCKPGIILCGDAAAILDPASGQGILNALYSGIKAAETVYKCILYYNKEQKNLNEYNHWFYNLIDQKASQLHDEYKRLGIIFLT